MARIRSIGGAFEERSANAGAGESFSRKDFTMSSGKMQVTGGGSSQTIGKNGDPAPTPSQPSPLAYQAELTIRSWIGDQLPAEDALATAREIIEPLADTLATRDRERDTLFAEVDFLRQQITKLRKALEKAEAVMSIIEPRSDKAKYLQTLSAIRADLGKERE